MHRYVQRAITFAYAGGRLTERREFLISAVWDFIKRAAQIDGVLRIALIGSLATDKPHPKDADVLVTITEPVDMNKLAEFGRKLKGRTQAINSGADIFLTDPNGKYLGRTCRWTRCEPGARTSCYALNCGRVPYLYDDLQDLRLPSHLMVNPPLVLYPEVVLTERLPRDLIDKISRDPISSTLP